MKSFFISFLCLLHISTALSFPTEIITLSHTEPDLKSSFKALEQHKILESIIMTINKPRLPIVITKFTVCQAVFIASIGAIFSKINRLKLQAHFGTILSFANQYEGIALTSQLQKHWKYARQDSGVLLCDNILDSQRSILELKKNLLFVVLLAKMILNKKETLHFLSTQQQSESKVYSKSNQLKQKFFHFFKNYIDPKTNPYTEHLLQTIRLWFSFFNNSNETNTSDNFINYSLNET